MAIAVALSLVAYIAAIEVGNLYAAGEVVAIDRALALYVLSAVTAPLAMFYRWYLGLIVVVGLIAFVFTLRSKLPSIAKVGSLTGIMCTWLACGFWVVSQS